MATENPVKLISSLGTAGLLSDSMKSPDNARQDAYYDGYAKEFGLLLKDGTCFETTQKEDLFRRSGSAPPSVEGSLAAMGGLFPHYSTNPIYLPEDTTTNNNISSSDPLGAEEQLRSDPAYLAYYYSHVNLNPRLPPPLISRENWRVAQWIGAMQEKGNLQSLDDGGSRSLFLSQPVLKSHKEESEALTEDMAGSLLRQYSTEWVEGGGDGLIGLSPSGLGAARCKSFADLIQEEFPGRTRSSAFHLSRPSSRVGQDDGDDRIVESGSTAHTRSSTPAADLQMAAVLGSRSSTPNPLLQGGNLPNGHLSAAGSQYSHMNSTLGGTFGMPAHSTIERSFQNLSISDMQELVSSEEHGKTQKKPPRASSSAQSSSAYAQALLQLQSGTLSPNLYSAAMPSSYMASGNHHHQHPYYQNSHLGSSMYSPNYGLGSYSFDPASLLPAMMMGSPSGMEGADMQYMYKMGNPSNATFDPVYIQYMQRVAQEARAASSARGGGYMVSSSVYADLLAMQKSSNGSLASPVLSGSTAVAAKRVVDPTDESCICSLLEEFKNSKTKCFELSDITGKVLEFSVDQHGSRFIQQKLEVAKPEEKEFVFREVFPRALTLMTDVFGNYVIQKFFEHGTPQHKTELANQLVGHVLSLSLQMYGCRVIQKAIEALDVDQQTRIVAELDGNVIRCVRDQNGNHVIQKCIECVPQDRIQFIISAFFGQVVTLSTHPYGCRVIQRVLEHCSDEAIQQHVMDEILQSICNLSHDQYGNYVVQHVLEHGKPHERSKIIKKLAGQFVPMSQHKFASNVVEKCLQFGRHTERQILINEMLGDTDENEPLQAMMKDQFANYVVQKVLETCDEKQREILLARIKVHLHTLKKYTYGKHIVARVEKLVVAGERRNASQSAQKPTI